MPLSCRSKVRGGTSQKGGYLPLETGVSAVRYPIPQRTFEYVATVHTVTGDVPFADSRPLGAGLRSLRF